MAKKVLTIIDTAYRCTIEEQDDPAVWITHAMKGAGGDFSVLLRGSAVNYATRNQDASGLRFGDRKQTKPPRLAEDVAKLIGKGIPVYLVAEDVKDRGLGGADLIDGVEQVSRSGVAKLFDAHDQVWHW